MLSSAGSVKGQSEMTTAPFNEQIDQRAGIGFAITGFNSSFTYFVSPNYSVRYHRHWFGFTPFYGRLDGLPKQQDVGIGIDYRLYPFKNLNSTLLYFPIGAHYNHKWADKSQKDAMLYKAGFGVEALFGKHLAISLDANFGVGQILTSKIQSNEAPNLGSSNLMNFYFLPVIRLSYGL